MGRVQRGSRVWRGWTSLRIGGGRLALGDMRPGLVVDLEVSLDPGLYDLQVMHFGDPRVAPIGRMRVLRKGARAVVGRRIGRVSVDEAAIGLCDLDGVLAALGGDRNRLVEWTEPVRRSGVDRGTKILDRKKELVLAWFMPGEGDGVYGVRELRVRGARAGIEVECLPEDYGDIVEVPVFYDFRIAIALERRGQEPLHVVVERGLDKANPYRHTSPFINQVRWDLMESVALASCPGLGVPRRISLQFQSPNGDRRENRTYVGSDLAGLPAGVTMRLVAERVARLLKADFRRSKRSFQEASPIHVGLTFASGRRCKQCLALGIRDHASKDPDGIHPENVVEDLLGVVRNRIPWKRPIAQLIPGATRFSAVEAVIRRSVGGDPNRMRPYRTLRLPRKMIAQLGSARTVERVAGLLEAWFESEVESTLRQYPSAAADPD